MANSTPVAEPQGDALDQVVLFQAADGKVSLDVRLEADSVWLSQAQMAELFGRERSVISKHIGNVFREGELEAKSTCAKFAQVQTEGTRVIQRQVDFYNLDVIISVGYRVKSLRGTQFRIWATQVLHQHLVQGYTLHQRRLQERGLGELEQALALMARTLSSHALVSDEGQAVLEVVQRYSRAWRWLLAYDEDRLPPITEQPDASPQALGLAEAKRAIETLRADLARCGEATPLFGQDNRQALAGIIGAIEQTFDGQPLYPTAQLRAAHLLYFVIKDHPFADGNKRIGTLLFLEFLRRNQLLLLADGQPRIADNGMAALALLIAESAPQQKDLMIRLVIALLEDQP
ncbi:MAG: RhuM family protein [Synechococcaceae cyanobacterium]